MVIYILEHKTILDTYKPTKYFARLEDAKSDFDVCVSYGDTCRIVEKTINDDSPACVVYTSSHDH